MPRTCDWGLNRTQLLASERAACFHCFEEFAPSAVTSWCDGEPPGQTALCPHCEVDSVVGFNGPVDREWLKAQHKGAFGP
jgi:hypothetical protein